MQKLCYSRIFKRKVVLKDKEQRVLIQTNEAMDSAEDNRIAKQARKAGEDKIKEDLFFCKEIRETGRSENFFRYY
jgi:hypothetical protein